VSILLERRGTTLLLTIDRPERSNALDARAIHDIGLALTDAESDPEIDVVVITGAGDRAFCAGIDLKAFAENQGPPVPADGPDLGVLLRRVYPKPVIAAVNGAAYGGGFELVLGCDLVLATPQATFALPEVRWGLVAAGAGIRHLARRIPLALALEIALTGMPVDAARAAALGLVNRVVPSPDLLEAALELAAAISRNSPLAVQFTKHHMHAFADSVPGADAAFEQGIGQILNSDDAREGAAAFTEKRSAVWRRR
jgi:enoyl-CoA hydratase